MGDGGWGPEDERWRIAAGLRGAPDAAIVCLLSSVLSYIPCEVAIRIAGAAPELAAGVAPLARHNLSQFASALWASRQILSLFPRLGRAAFDSGSAQSLRKAALLKERAGRAVHLPLEKRRRSTDRDQNGIRRGKRIFAFQPFAATFAHLKDVSAVFVICVTDCLETIKLQGSHGLVAFVAFRPRGLPCVNDEDLVVSRQLVQRCPRNVQLAQLLLLRCRRTGRRLHYVLPGAPRRTDHLSDSLAERVVLVAEIASAEERRGVVDKARKRERVHLPVATVMTQYVDW